jgi:hypothetical protein
LKIAAPTATNMKARKKVGSEVNWPSMKYETIITR